MGRRRRKGKGSTTPLPPAKPLTEAVVGKIQAWAEEAADSVGLVLYDVAVKGGWIIQVFVDRPGAFEPGSGVQVDECVSVSRYLEGYLDVDDDVWPNYTLEVSSPGVERKLTKPRHFELSVGHDVRIVVHNPIEKRNVFEGKITAFDGNVVNVVCGEDDAVDIDYANIAKARLTYVFSE